MKRFHILSLITFCCLYSCSSDENEIISLLGTWQLFSVSYDCPDRPEYTTSFEGDDGCVTVHEQDRMCLRFEFYEDGTGQLITQFERESEGTAFSYTMDEMTSSVSVCVKSECEVLQLATNELSINTKEEGCDSILLFNKL